jgi:hypothetical protein
MLNLVEQRRMCPVVGSLTFGVKGQDRNFEGQVNLTFRIENCGLCSGEEDGFFWTEKSSKMDDDHFVKEDDFLSHKEDD